jgi:hypothetical protein
MAIPEQRTTTTDRLDDASLAELMRQLSEQSSLLARREVELAKAELTAKGRSLGIGLGEFGAAGLVAVLALGALTATVILVLAEAVDAWLAALIVTVAYLAVAGVLALAGKRKAEEAAPPAPERTTQSVKQDVAAVKESAKEGRA